MWCPVRFGRRAPNCFGSRSNTITSRRRWRCEWPHAGSRLQYARLSAIRPPFVDVVVSSVDHAAKRFPCHARRAPRTKPPPNDGFPSVGRSDSVRGLPWLLQRGASSRLPVVDVRSSFGLRPRRDGRNDASAGGRATGREVDPDPHGGDCRRAGCALWRDGCGCQVVDDGDGRRLPRRRCRRLRGEVGARRRTSHGVVAGGPRRRRSAEPRPLEPVRQPAASGGHEQPISVRLQRAQLRPEVRQDHHRVGISFWASGVHLLYFTNIFIYRTG